MNPDKEKRFSIIIPASNDVSQWVRYDFGSGTAQINRGHLTEIVTPSEKIIPVDHGAVIVDPTSPVYDPNHGETGRIAPQGLSPVYTAETDHGSVEIDRAAPYFDANAGETGQWVDPTSSFTMPPEVG